MEFELQETFVLQFQGNPGLPPSARVEKHFHLYTIHFFTIGAKNIVGEWILFSSFFLDFRDAFQNKFWACALQFILNLSYDLQRDSKLKELKKKRLSYSN